MFAIGGVIWDIYTDIRDKRMFQRNDEEQKRKTVGSAKILVEALELNRSTVRWSLVRVAANCIVLAARKPRESRRYPVIGGLKGA